MQSPITRVHSGAHSGASATTSQLSCAALLGPRPWLQLARLRSHPLLPPTGLAAGSTGRLCLHGGCRPLQPRRQARINALGETSPSDGKRGDGDGPREGRGHHKIDPVRLLERLYEPQRVGAEYGEGFVQFRLRGDAKRLDVDALNERLHASGADRMRHAMKPDERLGMIFNLSGVLLDTRRLQRRAWKALAAEEALPMPAMERQLYDVRPERAITEVLQWTQDWPAAQRLSARFGELLAAEMEGVRSPLPGAAEWLRALHSANVPCAVVSSLDRMDTRSCLQQLGLSGYFQADVSAEDECGSLAQRFLSAALKLGRPPNACVVFDSCPSGITAAHNTTMKVVAVRTLHRSYQLKAADLTCGSMADLSVYNMRRLFALADAGLEFMSLRKDAGDGVVSRRRLRNATLEPDGSDSPP